MNRHLRILLIAVAVVCVAMVSILTGFYLMETQSTGVAISWHAFLVSVIALSLAWGVLLSVRPEDVARQELQLLSVVTRGLLWVFGIIACSVTLADGIPSQAGQIMSNLLFTAALPALPWGYDKYNKIMSSYEDIYLRY